MQIECLSGEQVAALVHEFGGVYRAAFAAAPYHRQDPEVREFIRALPLHTQREGFRSSVAFGDPDGQLVGIAYGYRSLPGQWWYDNVSRALGDKATRLWLAEAFQVTEVAVVPANQGQGVGGALLDALLERLPYARAVLSTLDAETAGRSMYRSRGWQELLTGFYFPGVPRRYAIMGRLLDPD